MLQIQFGFNLFLGIFFGVISTVCLNLGKGVQRIGAETLGKDMLKKWRENPQDHRKIVIWLVGTLMTFLAAVWQVVAQLYLDRASTFVALNGVGILSVVLFSFYVIKEKISPLQIVGITTIIAGTTLLALGYAEAPMPSPNLDFLVFSIIATAAGFVMAIASIKLHKGHGIVFGIIAGMFNGFAAILTAFASETGNQELIGTLVNAWLILSIVLGQGAFWTTQYAFKKGGNASLVVPAMASFLILIPYINDAVVYHVQFGNFQIISFFLNLAGIILLCVSSSKNLNRLMSSPVIKATGEFPAEKIAQSS